MAPLSCKQSCALVHHTPSVSYKRTSIPVPDPRRGMQDPCVRGHSKTTPVLSTTAPTAVPLGAAITILCRWEGREGRGWERRERGGRDWWGKGGRERRGGRVGGREGAVGKERDGMGWHGSDGEKLKKGASYRYSELDCIECNIYRTAVLHYPYLSHPRQIPSYIICRNAEAEGNMLLMNWSLTRVTAPLKRYSFCLT